MAEQKYKRYSKEFKLEAVRLAQAGDKPVTQIARELGVRVNQLYKWKKELGDKAGDAFPGKGRQGSKDAELTALRRELERVKAENEILKKAALYSTDRCNTRL